MHWDYAHTPHIWPMLASAVFNAALGFYGWRRRSVPGALPFAIMLLFTMLWAAGAALELAAVDLATKLFWFKFQGVMKIPAATAELCFGLQYAGLGRWLTRRNLVLLSLLPLLALILVLTNDWHHWLWLGFTVAGDVRPLRGSLAWMLVGYTYLLALAMFVLLIPLFVRSPQHRWLAALILGEVLLTRAASLLDMSGINPFAPMEPTVLVWNAGALLYALALFGFRMFDPIPVARKTVIEQMQEGMLVLDASQKIVDLNPAAERLLGLPAARVRGHPALEILPACPDLKARLAERGAAQLEVNFGDGRDARHYVLHLSPLKERRGFPLGTLILLHDVTEQKRAQAQLLEQQRALAMLSERERLAGELHDDLGQVLAFIHTQGQTVRRLLARGEIPKADEYVASLVEAAGEADTDLRESILGLRAPLAGLGLMPVLQDYLRRFEQRYGLPAELSLPEAGLEGAFEPVAEAHILRILQEGLTNARKHANARRVQVAFALQDDGVQIVVRDDGQGFEPTELSAGPCRGFGLQLMRERAEKIGGALEFRSARGEGTQVILTVPRK